MACDYERPCGGMRILDELLSATRGEDTFKCLNAHTFPGPSLPALTGALVGDPPPETLTTETPMATRKCSGCGAPGRRLDSCPTCKGKAKAPAKGPEKAKANKKPHKKPAPRQKVDFGQKSTRKARPPRTGGASDFAALERRLEVQITKYRARIGQLETAKKALRELAALVQG